MTDWQKLVTSTLNIVVKFEAFRVFHGGEMQKYTLPESNIALKMDDWKISFLVGFTLASWQVLY